MATEIERKFLVTDDTFRRLAPAVACRQGYLNLDRQRTVRVRTMHGKGFLTIKGLTIGACRSEYEYQIPLQEAEAILSDLCAKPLIEKNRHEIAYKGFIWQVDEFLGQNQGLILAEVQLARRDQKFESPSWIGKEVTEDPRYFNSNLVRHPFGPGF